MLDKQSRAELNHRMCYAYAECKSFGAVAKQFGVYPQQVKRAWESLSEEEQQSIIDTNTDVKENISRRAKSQGKMPPAAIPSIEALNQATAIGEAIASNDFVTNVVEARTLLGRELRRRCATGIIEGMSDKNLGTMLRLVMSFTDDSKDDKDAPESSTLERLRAQLTSEIYSHKEVN